MPFMSLPLQELEWIQKTLLKQKETLSVAESCTGGLLSSWFTHLPGSSLYFKGAVISYQTEVKENLLQVPSQVIKEKGVVSEDCAWLMAKGVKNLLKTDWSLSVTGFASPTQKPEEEVGKVAFALCSKIAYKTKLQYFKEVNREDVRTQATLFAIHFLVSELKQKNN